MAWIQHHWKASFFQAVFTHSGTGTSQTPLWRHQIRRQVGIEGSGCEFILVNILLHETLNAFYGTVRVHQCSISCRIIVAGLFLLVHLLKVPLNYPQALGIFACFFQHKKSCQILFSQYCIINSLSWKAAFLNLVSFRFIGIQFP